MSLNVELKRGTALVLAGLAESGKTTLARELARKHGHWIEATCSIFGNPFALGDVLGAEPAVVIVDGLPRRDEELAILKSILTRDEFFCNRKHREAKMVKTPMFVFCTNDPRSIHMAATWRRFTVAIVENEEVVDVVEDQV